MKKYLILFPLIAAAGLLTGCEKHINVSQVPGSVQKTFETRYPGATNVEWEKEGNRIEAEFMFNGRDIEAEFNPDGSFITEE